MIPSEAVGHEGAGTSDGPPVFTPPSTWEGWRRFVDLPGPDQLLADHTSWSPDERLDYHSQFVVLTTPAYTQASLSVRRLMLLNRRQQGTARRGLIISGPPTTGKTTTLLEMGRSFELADRARHPGRSDRLPVVFIAVPPASTPKMLVSEFARFLGITIAGRMNQAQITDAVCHQLCELATQLVLVDDVHLLDTRTRAGAETSDQMKHLGERIPATFVYAGVEVETSPLLTGQRGAQLAGRFKLQRCMPLPYGTAAQREVWAELVGDMEQALRLEQHRVGTLARHAEYLHRRTGGAMGSLSHLIREAALAAILDGSEKITKQLLQSIQLDFRAEQQARPSHRRPARARVGGAG
ncbi:TniB family NTP-binding protein [Streptomyces althioticus]|uniref:TniB family NTP-binding protein n=1 Tax=Streptomyces althioticus TaxID=83380 RepID=UPI0036FA54A1